MRGEVTANKASRQALADTVSAHSASFDGAGPAVATEAATKKRPKPQKQPKVGEGGRVHKPTSHDQLLCLLIEVKSPEEERKKAFQNDLKQFGTHYFYGGCKLIFCV